MKQITLVRCPKESPMSSRPWLMKTSEVVTGVGEVVEVSLSVA